MAIHEQHVSAPNPGDVAFEFMHFARPADCRVGGECEQAWRYRLTRDCEVAIAGKDGIGEGWGGIKADEVTEVLIGKRALVGEGLLGLVGRAVPYPKSAARIV